MRIVGAGDIRVRPRSNDVLPFGCTALRRVDDQRRMWIQAAYSPAGFRGIEPSEWAMYDITVVCPLPRQP
jgi:hypothetical protein